jgi:antitoxin component of RelBE/YafQ-DinJ toxin-antitoxin module|tara:strand:+ start:131 stop:298 length:168 start_codon:yes stop_codon:yes gene_type:complete
MGMEMVNAIRQTLMMVSGETTVPVGLLLEDDDFMEYLESGDAEFTDLLHWVNENY